MKRITLLMICGALSGCAVIAVADLAVTTAATVAKAGVKTVGAAVDAVTSDKKEKPKDK
jgi:hypothetical protein